MDRKAAFKLHLKVSCKSNNNKNWGRIWEYEVEAEGADDIVYNGQTDQKKEIWG